MTSNFARDLETRYELFAAHLGKMVFHWDQANSDDYAKGIQHLPAFLSLTADAGLEAHQKERVFMVDKVLQELREYWGADDTSGEGIKSDGYEAEIPKRLKYSVNSSE
ncbi:hypothetical protein DDE82_001759 [Stemphylium lycopersici]|uniref:Uncharacterized protein n=1 Tax=Stemphylium lycopersici TaxID=183478 RepID=A0A364MTV6_STELY|nr:hypothetical protein DDE83_008197 [Stemphylium lycopersici]RAR09250.1 hypothetical protein DDE82_001759 [Stemphylium lycopersici]